jgi:hypothetical protein
VIGGRQAPFPSQVRASVAVVVPVGHDGSAHCVPAACSWQLPAPLQKPVLPQLVAAWAGHCPRGSIPSSGTGVHVPSAPASVHDMQLALQAVAQQIPSTQKPLWQSAGPPQLAPGGSRPHVPPAQTLGGAQSASEVQVDLQAAMPHRNG